MTPDVKPKTMIFKCEDEGNGRSWTMTFEDGSVTITGGTDEASYEPVRMSYYSINYFIAQLQAALSMVAA